MAHSSFIALSLHVDYKFIVGGPWKSHSFTLTNDFCSSFFMSAVTVWMPWLQHAFRQDVIPSLHSSLGAPDLKSRFCGEGGYWILGVSAAVDSGHSHPYNGSYVDLS